MGKISSYQLLVLTALYQLGTTIIFGFASTAGRDCWISSIISAVLGGILILMYTVIARLNPGLTLVEWYPTQFGKWLGTPIAWMYPLLSLYEAGRLLTDIKDMLPPVILPKTPKLLITSLFLLIVAYVSISGIEVLGRLAEILMPVILIFFILEIILIAGSGIIKMDHVLPIAGKGWGRILKAVWPLGVTQTYGETIYFAMIWPYVKQQKKILRTSIIASVVSTLIITTLDLMSVLVLGESNFSRSIYPLFKLVQQINVADFIENLDALAVLFLLTTAFFKCAVKIACISLAIQKLSYAKSHITFIVPSVLIVLYLAMTMANNVLDHIEAGLKILPKTLWMYFFIFLPFSLFVVSCIRWLYNRSKSKATA